VVARGALGVGLEVRGADAVDQGRQHGVRGPQMGKRLRGIESGRLGPGSRSWHRPGTIPAMHRPLPRPAARAAVLACLAAALCAALPQAPAVAAPVAFPQAGPVLSGPRVVLAFLPLAERLPKLPAEADLELAEEPPLAFVPILDRLEARPDLALGLSSATQGQYDRTQALLDITQGTRVSLSGYHPKRPGPLVFTRAGDGSLFVGWLEVGVRAAGAPAELHPGLLGAKVPGGAGYVGVRGRDQLEAVAAASPAGRVGFVTIGSADDVAARAQALAQRRRLVVVGLPTGFEGDSAVDRLIANRRSDELLIVMQSPPDRRSPQLLPTGIAGLGSAGRLASSTTHLDGIVAGIALDHRDSLRVVLEGLGVTGRTTADLRALKHALVRVLAPAATAVMLDAELGRTALTDGSIPVGVGLIMPLEAQGYETQGDRRLTTLLADFSPGDALRTGADACKLLLPYRVDDEPAADRQDALVTATVGACHAVGLPLVVEPVVHRLSSETEAGHAAAYPSLVVAAVARLRSLGADLLKLPFPVRDPGSCRALADACGDTPWVLLGGGGATGVDALVDQIRIAGEAGASGFLAGRAIWGPALRVDVSQTDRRAATIARPSFVRCRTMAAAACRPLPSGPG